MRILFWGTPQFALPALRALGDEGHELVGVVTRPDRPAGRGRPVAISPVKEFAVEEGLPVLQPERASDAEFLAAARALKPDVSIVVAYGQILKPEALGLPPLGSINLHASLLPELRGAAPIHWAIIHGHEETGASIMQMTVGLDSGPVLYQVTEPIRADETMSELAIRLSEIGAEALVEALTMMEVGEVEATPQEEARATYAPKLGREEAHLDWTLPAIEVSRWIRGLDAVPGAWSALNGGDPVKLFTPRIEIRSGPPGEILEVDEEVGVLIGAGEDAVRVREVQPSGRRRMTAGDWVRGRGVQVGDRLS
jgi:methionyl-tRNA formyltransferase